MPELNTTWPIIMRYKKIQGNYIEVLNKTGNPYLKDLAGIAKYEDSIRTILADIPRSSLLTREVLSRLFGNTSHFEYPYTHDHFVNAWINKNTSNFYSQGTVSGDFFGQLLGLLFTESRLYPNEEKNRTEKTKEEFYHADNKGKFAFAYFDKNGVPCSVAIDYLKSRPDYWILTVMRNNNADPEFREVTVFCYEDLIEAEGDEQLEASEVTSQLDALLNSEVASALMKNCISPKGEVNIEQFSSMENVFSDDRAYLQTVGNETLDFKHKQYKKLIHLQSQYLKNLEAGYKLKKQIIAEEYSKYSKIKEQTQLSEKNSKSIFKRNDFAIDTIIFSLILVTIGIVLMATGLFSTAGIVLAFLGGLGLLASSLAIYATESKFNRKTKIKSERAIERDNTIYNSLNQIMDNYYQLAVKEISDNFEEICREMMDTEDPKLARELLNTYKDRVEPVTLKLLPDFEALCETLAKTHSSPFFDKLRLVPNPSLKISLIPSLETKEEQPLSESEDENYQFEEDEWSDVESCNSTKNYSSDGPTLFTPKTSKEKSHPKDKKRESLVSSNSSSEEMSDSSQEDRATFDTDANTKDEQRAAGIGSF